MNPTNAEDVFWHHKSSTSHWTRLKSKSAGADSGKSRTISKASPGRWLLKHREHSSSAARLPGQAKVPKRTSKKASKKRSTAPRATCHHDSSALCCMTWSDARYHRSLRMLQASAPEFLEWHVTWNHDTKLYPNNPKSHAWTSSDVWPASLDAHALGSVGTCNSNEFQHAEIWSMRGGIQQHDANRYEEEEEVIHHSRPCQSKTL